MCVNGKCGLAQKLDRENARGFAPDAREICKQIEIGWDFSVVVGKNCFTCGDNVFRFVAIKPGGINVAFKLGGVGVCEIGDGFVFLKQCFCDDVHALVCTLGG